MPQIIFNRLHILVLVYVQSRVDDLKAKVPAAIVWDFDLYGYVF